jgi:hypothetical protein
MMIARTDHSDPISPTFWDLTQIARLEELEVVALQWLLEEERSSEADFGMADHYFSARAEFRLGHVISAGACRELLHCVDDQPSNRYRFMAAHLAEAVLI